MPEELKRLYAKADSVMFQESRTINAFATEDLADLTAYDTLINAAYLTSHLALITTAEGVPTAEVIADQLSQKSEAVKQDMSACASHYQDIKHFALKAFETSPGTLNEFGFDNFDKARRSQAEMIVFMRTLNTVVEAYAAQLRTKGAPDALIAQGPALLDSLQTHNSEQEKFKGTAEGLTATRVTANNEVWKVNVVLCRAGKRVYRNDYAKYQRYILYPDARKSPEIVQKYTVLAPGATVSPDIQVAPGVVLLFRTRNTAIRIFRHTVQHEPAGDTGLDLNKGSEIVLNFEEIPGTGDFLNITNLSTEEEGQFLVAPAE